MLWNKIIIPSASVAVSHWVAWDTGDVGSIMSTMVDSSGNIYYAGYVFNAGFQTAHITKTDSSGTVLWTKGLYNTGNTSEFRGVGVDGSGNVYAAGTYFTGSIYNILVAKFNSAGTLQWQRSLAGASYDEAYGIAVDGSGNSHVVGYTISGTAEALIAKYDTSGTLLWQTKIGGGSTDYGTGVALDGSGNVYVSGLTYSAGAGNSDALIAKFTSGGAITWQRTLGTTNDDHGQSIVVDGLGSVYIGGYTYRGGIGFDFLVAKYNSAGTFQWQQGIGGASNDDKGRFVAVDGSNNVYIAGLTTSVNPGINDLLVAKYSSGGAIQWQRSIGTTGNEPETSANLIASGLYIDSSNNMNLGFGSADGRTFRAKLPTDGTKTGVYNVSGLSITYQTTTLTTGVASGTSGTPTLTVAAAGLVSSASSLTVVSPTFTSFLLNI